MDFSERLKLAAERAGVPYQQSTIARALGASRQSVFEWFHGRTPELPQIANIAKVFGVDPVWLATGEGEMVPKPLATGLSKEEHEIIRIYRSAQPARRKALYDMARALGKAMVLLSLAIPGFFASVLPGPFNNNLFAFQVSRIHIKFRSLSIVPA